MMMKRAAAAVVLAGVLATTGAGASSAATPHHRDPWAWSHGQTYATCGLYRYWYPECRTPRPLPHPLHGWAARIVASWGYSW
jgi:hypothetical protein